MDEDNGKETLSKQTVQQVCTHRHSEHYAQVEHTSSLLTMLGINIVGRAQTV